MWGTHAVRCGVHMSVCCLIHGSTQSPAGWQLLIPELRRCGHDAFTVDLPVDEPEAGTTRYADVIATEIRSAERDNVIAVAHSVSGIFLPLLLDRCAVQRLVFLAAFVPVLGMSPLQQFASEPNLMNSAWVGKNPTDDTVAREFLFHDCAPDVVRWALSTRRLLVARGALAETCPLTEWPDVPISSIVCADDRYYFALVVAPNRARAAWRGTDRSARRPLSSRVATCCTRRCSRLLGGLASDGVRATSITDCFVSSQVRRFVRGERSFCVPSRRAATPE